MRKGPIYTEELCSRFRELARRSYVITPNLTEALLLLYGKNKMEEIWKEFQSFSGEERLAQIRETGYRLAKRFSLPAVVITGVDHREEDEPLIISILDATQQASSSMMQFPAIFTPISVGDL